KLRVDGKYEVVEELENSEEVLEVAKKYIEMCNEKFCHVKNSWVEAVGVDNKEINNILLSIKRAIDSGSCISESIEILYNTYKYDTPKLIVSLIYLGKWMKENEIIEAIKTIDKIKDEFLKNSISFKFVEMDKNKDEKETEIEGVIYR
ncbi:hypothetical protein, partial [Methanocaldococcus sp.]